jgi:hypothetical protein
MWLQTFPFTEFRNPFTPNQKTDLCTLRKSQMQKVVTLGLQFQ